MFLDLLQEELREFKNVEPEAKYWLKILYQEWQKEWDDMPPGLKDIKLDTFLTNPERQTVFCKVVDAILKRIEQNFHESEFLLREITKVKKLVQLID